MGRSIYVHIPFCERKCPYCDFYSIADRSQASAYIEALLQEIRAFAGSEVRFDDMTDLPDTLYIGGGTPSSIPAEDIAKIVNSIRKLFGLGDNSEITIEVNPSSLTMDKALIYKDCGINRVSMGVQSLDDQVLKTLGRLHDSDCARRAIDILKNAGFTNISCDLMCGIPGQTISSAEESARELTELGIKHISCYSLSIEEGTLFEQRYKDNIEDLVPPEEEREMYHRVRALLAAKGLARYEISNNSVGGYESRHNLNYWAGGNYYAFGAAAAGYLQDMRFTHPASVAAYIEAAKAITPESIKEYFDSKQEKSDLLITTDIMDREEKMKEYPFLALRTSYGMSRKVFLERFNVQIDEFFADAIRKNIDEGLLIEFEDTIRLTDKGFDFADKVIRDMI